jgi:hypothetical protein
MVVGEPGIGKTALIEQLATYVTLRGGKTMVGHCYEEGSLSLPYLAFVEALRSYVLEREPEGLATDLGTRSVDVAPPGVIVGGESQEIASQGGRVICMIGSNNPLFHLESDRWPDAVDIEAVAGFSNAFTDIALQLANA